MLEFVLSKMVLIVFSIAVLIASGSMVTSYYSEQQIDETESSFQKIVGIVIQTCRFDSDCTMRIELDRYLGSGSILRLGSGSVVLVQEGRVLSEDLPEDVLLRVINPDGSEATTIDLANGDVMVLERCWENDSPRISIYIEKVDATFSTAATNRSTSSIVL